MKKRCEKCPVRLAALALNNHLLANVGPNADWDLDLVARSKPAAKRVNRLLRELDRALRCIK